MEGGATIKIFSRSFSNDSMNSLLMVLFLYINIITLPLVQALGSSIIFWIVLLGITAYSIFLNQVFYWKFVLITITISLFFLFNLLLVDNKQDVLQYFLLFIRYGILSLYFVMLVTDFKKLVKYACYTSIISFFILNFFIGFYQETNGYMDLGVYLGYCVLGFTLYFYNIKRNRFIFVLLIVSFFEILVLGNRSALLACVGVLIYFQIRNMKTTKLGIALLSLKLTFFSITIAILYLNMYKILEFIMQIAQKFGFYSYSLTKYILILQEGFSGVLSQSSGRDVVYSTAYKLIQDSYFMPNGVNYFAQFTNYTIPYPHNLFLEVTLDFGIFGLILFCIFLIYLVKRYLHFSKINNEYRDFVAILAIIGFTRLMFSDSYWQEPLFWLCIGFILFSKKSSENFIEKKKISLSS